MTNYYNENEPFAAQTLRNLIAAGHIAHGVVDERSIEDVRPSDLAGFTQCHFFAGVGVWSYALRRAGWPDDRPVWTGSCPCQPFSAAGKGAAFADERHLWPAFHHLIKQRKPATVFGEQVASKDADPWIDLVHTDMEALGYAFGAVPFPSAGIGAPHIRDRLYWVAHAQRAGVRARGQSEDVGPSRGLQGARGERQWVRADIGERSAVCGVADHNQHGRSAQPIAGVHDAERHAESCGGAVRLGHPDRSRPQGGERGRELHDAQLAPTERAGGVGGLADDIVQHRQGRQPGLGAEYDQSGRVEGAAAIAGLRGDLRTGPTNGLWRDADWLLCRDGKWRPVEPGTFPLAHGAPARVGRLRAYGNAINAEAAIAFIEASGVM